MRTAALSTDPIQNSPWRQWSDAGRPATSMRVPQAGPGAGEWCWKCATSTARHLPGHLLRRPRGRDRRARAWSCRRSEVVQSSSASTRVTAERFECPADARTRPTQGAMAAAWRWCRRIAVSRPRHGSVDRHATRPSPRRRALSRFGLLLVAVNGAQLGSGPRACRRVRTPLRRRLSTLSGGQPAEGRPGEMAVDTAAGPDRPTSHARYRRRNQGRGAPVMSGLAAQGVAVVMVSSELPEVRHGRRCS